MRSTVNKSVNFKDYKLEAKVLGAVVSIKDLTLPLRPNQLWNVIGDIADCLIENRHYELIDGYAAIAGVLDATWIAAVKTEMVNPIMLNFDVVPESWYRINPYFELVSSRISNYYKALKAEIEDPTELMVLGNNFILDKKFAIAGNPDENLDVFTPLHDYKGKLSMTMIYMSHRTLKTFTTLIFQLFHRISSLCDHTDKTLNYKFSVIKLALGHIITTFIPNVIRPLEKSTWKYICDKVKAEMTDLYWKIGC